MNYRYIAIEGPHGAGKTALAQKLAERYQMSLLLEDSQQNPFLTGLYQNRRHYALPYQLHLLLQRGVCASELTAQVESETFIPRIADFAFNREVFLPQVMLEEPEWLLYRALQQKVMPVHPVPDLMIYLQASPERLAKRIAQRALPHERDFPDGYLKAVVTAYSEYFHSYDAAALMIVNTDNIDFVANPDDFELLLARIQEMRGPRSYFNKSI